MIGTQILETTYYRDTIKHLSKTSEKLMDEILSLLEQIDVPEDTIRKLWLTTTRESFHTFMKHADEDEPIRTEEQFKRFYPNKKIWIPLYGFSYENHKYLRINSMTIEIEEDERSIHYYGADCDKILKWVKKAAIDSLNKVRNGTYNDEVRNELPYTYRYGTIQRSIYWSLHPTDKKRWMGDLTEEECAEFIQTAKAYKNEPKTVIKGMTFHKYFDMAIACYKKLGLEMLEDDIKTFFAYAEDFGGQVLEKEVDYESEQNFTDFVDGRCGNMGGHPFGIRRGSSRTRIMLYPEHKDDGFYLLLGGNPNWNVCGLVKCFLALKELGVPFQMSAPEETIKYLKQEDKIGFVSVECLPIYCQTHFPDMRIGDFRHYDPKADKKLFDKVDWLPIQEVKLKV